MKQVIKEIMEETGFDKMSLSGKMTAGWWCLSMVMLTLYINMWITALTILSFVISTICLVNSYNNVKSNETSND